MIRPVLLTVLVVCSLGAPFVAAQPAAGDVVSEAPTDDDGATSDADIGDDYTNDTEERWYERSGDDGENRSDYDAGEEDPDRDGPDGGADEREPGENETDDGESPESADGAEEPDGPDEQDDNEAEPAGERNESEDGDRWNESEDDRQWNESMNVSEYVLDILFEPDLDGPDGTAYDVAGDGGVGTLADDVARTLGPSEREEQANSGPPMAREARYPSSDDGGAAAGTAGDGNAGAAQSVTVEGDGPATREGAIDRSGGGDPAGDGPAGGSPAGAGAALFVTVGCLGGTRVAATQANLLAAPASEGTLATLRRYAGEYLARLPEVVLPSVVGYSRTDGSDPLENDTRADIYELVCESPGIYHAQLAEETGVTVETVRYHCRILAEEGLVEPQKLRGRRRLFPVTMDDNDPELAAAIVDSAASDVLSAIDRLEPATLSTVADAVGCAPSTVAHHLDRLEEDGLVTRERDGGSVRLRLRRSTRTALQGRVADD